MRDTVELDEAIEECRSHPNASATLRFPVEAGILTRGQVKQALAQAAWKLGLEISYTEERGILLSTIFYEVSGMSEDLIPFLKYVHSLT